MHLKCVANHLKRAPVSFRASANAILQPLTTYKRLCSLRPSVPVCTASTLTSCRIRLFGSQDGRRPLSYRFIRLTSRIRIADMTLEEIIAALDREIATLEEARALLAPWSRKAASNFSISRSGRKPIAKPHVPQKRKQKVRRDTVTTPFTVTTPSSSEAQEYALPRKEAPKTITGVKRTRKPRASSGRTKPRPVVGTALTSSTPVGPVVASAAAVRDELQRRTQTHRQPHPVRTSIATNFPFGALAERITKEREAAYKAAELSLTKLAAM